MTGIEPAYSAWEAISRAERPSYTGWSRALSANPNTEAFTVRLAHGSVPVRVWFGSVRGTTRQFGRAFRRV
jgi:hypothetical protein